jgi:DNA-binding NarL/FixJ family response regulator
MEKRLLVLIVDDDADFSRKLAGELISRYEVVLVTDRSQAQKAAMADRPDLVVLGTIRPRGDAFLLHRWFKKLPVFCNIPHIVVDAPAEKQLTTGWRKDEGLRMEAEEYFQRPIEISALLHFVDKVIDVETRTIKVLVADDHTVVREGISALLNLQRDIHIVGEAVDGRDAVEKTLQLYPDVVLMDIVMPGTNGLEATREIHRECREKVKVLVLSQYDDEENIRASCEAGAYGFIPKKSVSSQLLAAIRAVSRGERMNGTSMHNQLTA